MSIQTFFPINPQYMSWEDWNGNFLHYFGEEPIMYGPEEDWKLVAKNISQLTTLKVIPCQIQRRLQLGKTGHQHLVLF